MFESLIREAATRFHLGDNAGRFVRLLVDALFDDDTGGFAGARSRFNDAGLGDLFASWIGTTPGDNVLQPDQFNAAFGESAAQRIGNALNLPMASVNLAGAWLLPKIIGLLTRGGTVPTGRPADYDRWWTAAPAGAAAATAPHAAHHTPHVERRDEGGGLGFLKWLIPLILLLGAFLLFRSCNKEPAPAPVTPPAATTSAETAPVATVQPRFGFENVDGKVTVNGQVASEAEKTRLWDALKAAFGEGNVNGDITVDTSTAPARWLENLIVMLPDLKANGLQFGFDGDKLTIDTSALSEEERFNLSRAFRTRFGGYEIDGLWDRAAAAFARLKDGFSANDLVGALNLMEIYFDTDSDKITADSLSTLRSAADAIKRLPAGTTIEVGGHTDNTGDAAHNMDLSQRRAAAVVSKLQELGVAPGILSGKGYGQDKPRADNATEEGRAQNRRIEFTVTE